MTRRLITSHSPHQTPEHTRLYAVGDIHGRLDLWQQLAALIARDNADKPATSHIIFLGDYVDRGLHSRAVIEAMTALPADQHVFLLGNHEQVMRNVLKSGDSNLAADWLRFGGRETLLSYGVRPPALLTQAGLVRMIEEWRAIMPAHHTAFLHNLQTHVIFGDYYFCHAGIDPAKPLAAQTEDDLAWSRSKFIGHHGAFEKMIVHGHTISEDIDVQNNRLGIDTGAYATGCLTALALEGNRQWILQTNRA